MDQIVTALCGAHGAPYAQHRVREKATTAGMQEIEQRREQLPRMRGYNSSNYPV